MGKTVENQNKLLKKSIMFPFTTLLDQRFLTSWLCPYVYDGQLCKIVNSKRNVDFKT